MAWTNGKIFRAYLADVLDNTTALDLGSDGFKVALYGTTPTPDQNVTSANTAYGVGQWIAGNEIAQAVQWPVAGVALGTPVLNSASAGIVFFDAVDTASGTAATLLSVFGCLVYDTTVGTPVASQGICYNYFGGTQSVTNGQMTVVWNANGIMRYTL